MSVLTPYNTPGPVDVFVDGRRVASCFYADTTNGFVRANFVPLRINSRRNGVRWRKIRGQVEVRLR